MVHEQYKLAIFRQGRFPAPVAKVIRRLNEGQAVTPEDWDSFTLEALK